MQGQMNDVTGMVWTVLAESAQPLCFMDIFFKIINTERWSELNIRDVQNGLQFWKDADELTAVYRYGVMEFSIKDRVCPSSENPAANAATNQQKQKSKQASPSGTVTVGKRGSGKDGRKQHQKGAKHWRK